MTLIGKWFLHSFLRKVTVIGKWFLHTYRIMAVVKVETDIIASIRMSLIWCAVILVIMYVWTLKTYNIIFICNVIMCLTSCWPVIFSIRVNSLVLTIPLGGIKEKMSKLVINVIIMHVACLILVFNAIFNNISGTCI